MYHGQAPLTSLMRRKILWVQSKKAQVSRAVGRRLQSQVALLQHSVGKMFTLPVVLLQTSPGRGDFVFCLVWMLHCKASLQILPKAVIFASESQSWWHLAEDWINYQRGALYKREIFIQAGILVQWSGWECRLTAAVGELIWFTITEHL